MTEAPLVPLMKWCKPQNKSPSALEQRNAREKEDEDEAVDDERSKRISDKVGFQGNTYTQASNACNKNIGSLLCAMNLPFILEPYCEGFRFISITSL